MDQRQLIEWARTQAERLTAGESTLTATAEFFSRQGASVFVAEAKQFLDEAAIARQRGFGDRSHRSGMAALLTSWADIVEAGVVDAAPFEVRARFEAATDLMEQVDLLLEERDVVPAAAVMLAGAALEESLRALMEGCEEEITGSPGISKYAVALRKCDRLTRQEAKNVEAWGGLRNTAAHGHFDEITRDEAKVMSAGVNVFLQAHGVR